MRWWGMRNCYGIPLFWKSLCIVYCFDIYVYCHICLNIWLYVSVYIFIVYNYLFIHLSSFKQNHGIHLLHIHQKRPFFSPTLRWTISRFSVSWTAWNNVAKHLGRKGYEMTFKLIFIAFAWIFEKGLDKIRGWTVIFSFCKIDRWRDYTSKFHHDSTCFFF